jgi:hypothetical protein
LRGSTGIIVNERIDRFSPSTAGQNIFERSLSRVPVAANFVPVALVDRRDHEIVRDVL